MNLSKILLNTKTEVKQSAKLFGKMVVSLHENTLALLVCDNISEFQNSQIMERGVSLNSRWYITNSYLLILYYSN